MDSARRRQSRAIGARRQIAKSDFVRRVLIACSAAAASSAAYLAAFVRRRQAADPMQIMLAMLLMSQVLSLRQGFFACDKEAGTLRVPSPALPVTLNLNAGYGTRSVPTTLAARPRYAEQHETGRLCSGTAAVDSTVGQTAIPYVSAPNVVPPMPPPDSKKRLPFKRYMA